MTTNNPVRTQLYINGEYLSALSGEEYKLYNPARPTELVGYAASAGVEDVDLACQAAQQAFPAWAALSYQERADYLLKIADHLMANQEELEARVRLFTR